ncbi:Hint domain-containing protein [Rhodobacteraceae bacterium KMM 6894]|nr:Hint domain-containing protein [Rhodobacteraceae bacterium KMM 6894]
MSASTLSDLTFPHATICGHLTGTLIMSSRGYRPVEDLRVGHLVWTEDDGFQPILWTASKSPQHAPDGTAPSIPVRIPANAMGPGAPLRDMWVASEQRIALSHATAALYFQSYEVLAPAKALVGYRGIVQCAAPVPVHYHHIACARHQILRADGLASESVQGEDGTGPTARLALNTHEVRVLMAAAAGGPLDISPQQAIRRAA